MEGPCCFCRGGGGSVRGAPGPPARCGRRLSRVCWGSPREALVEMPPGPIVRLEGGVAAMGGALGEGSPPSRVARGALPSGERGAVVAWASAVRVGLGLRQGSLWRGVCLGGHGCGRTPLGLS